MYCCPSDEETQVQAGNITALHQAPGLKQVSQDWASNLGRADTQTPKPRPRTPAATAGPLCTHLHLYFPLVARFLSAQ